MASVFIQHTVRASLLHRKVSSLPPERLIPELRTGTLSHPPGFAAHRSEDEEYMVRRFGNVGGALLYRAVRLSVIWDSHSSAQD